MSPIWHLREMNYLGAHGHCFVLIGFTFLCMLVRYCVFCCFCDIIPTFGFTHQRILLVAANCTPAVY
jgi:hypothetical protein